MGKKHLVKSFLGQFVRTKHTDADPVELRLAAITNNSIFVGIEYRCPRPKKTLVDKVCTFFSNKDTRWEYLKDFYCKDPMYGDGRWFEHCFNYYTDDVHERLEDCRKTFVTLGDIKAHNAREMAKSKEYEKQRRVFLDRQEMIID